MKYLFSLITCVALVSFTTPANNTITEEERKYALNYLQEKKADFLKATQGLSEAQLKFKASPERWSIAECMEHIALAEGGLWQMLQGALQQPANPDKRSEIKFKDETILSIITDRSGKAKAPEFLQPSGKFKTSEEASQTFSTSRDQLIKFVETSQDDLRNHFGAHPVFGTLDTYQVILLVGGHQKRHTLQIEEVKTDKNFPKK
jgi:hypothetical protein